MKTAVFPGSFDPVTLGHADVIERAARLFDRVYVAIVPNGAKLHPMFTDEEKLALMRACVAHLPNVTAELWGGLLTDYAASVGAQFLVRAARNATDFDAEYQLSRIYADVSDGTLETVLLCADPRYQHISSTMVREMVKYKQDLTRYMPRAAAELVNGRK